MVVVTANSSDLNLLSPDRVISRYSKACGGDALLDVTTELSKGTLVRGTVGKVPL